MEQTFLPYIGAFAWVGLLLVVGTILRAKIKLLQQLFLPASLIGGLVGFVLMQFDLVGLPTSQGWQTIPTSAFAMITFHLFAFSFVGIGLMKSENKAGPVKNKIIFKGAAWIAVILSLCYAVQCLVGYGTFAAWNIFTDNNIASYIGALVGTGFTQGPGQAQAYASVWESSYGISNAVSIGLTFAALGFLVAGLVGVPLGKYVISKKLTVNNESGSFGNSDLTGILPYDSNESLGRETTHNSNINTFGLHLAMMLFIYGVAYMVALAQSLYTPKMIAQLAFGMLFTLALLVALIVKKLLVSFKVEHVFDNKTINAITSTCADFLICAVFMGIDTASLAGYGIPIAVSSVLATIITVFICIYFGLKLSEYRMERAMAAFGYATGTGANAIMLLRVVDSKFSTPVATEMGLVIVVQTITALPFLLIPLAPELGMTFIWAMAAITVACLVLLYLIQLIKPDAKTTS